MKKNLSTLFFLVLFNQIFAQIPSGYYNNASGKSGYELKTALYNIIKGHTTVSYGNLYDVYAGTYNSAPASDKKTNGKVWDMYSDIPGGTPPYEFTFNSDECGNYSNEGDCFNREHSFPQSWFNSSSPMVSDAFHVYPTDGKVNGIRSNYPYGETSSPTKTSLNGSKLGPCSFSGYTGTVFEPIDEYKGDFARTYFYMATRYENVIAGWQNNGNANDILNGTSNQVFDTWQLNLLYKWHTQDPVSQKEIDRNNAVYQVQNNRNPYIDYPEWVASVWGFAPATPSVQFSSSTGTIQEGTSGTKTYTVNVVSTSTANNPFTVTISVDGAGTTATSGVDFTLNTTSLTFSGSETSKAVQVTINGDAIAESSETVKLTLSNPTNDMALGSTTSHILTITDASTVPTLSETFDPCSNLNTWKAVSVTGAQVWACTTSGRNTSSGAQMNGFSGSAIANEDWLISPALQLNANAKISYWTKADFSGPLLEMYVSSNYSGTGDPTSASWTKITSATFATPSGNSTGTWTEAANIDLNSFAGNNRYVAFKYTSTATTNGAARWTVDDISFSNATLAVTATPVLNVTGSVNGFGNQNKNTTSASQSVTLNGSDLTDNVLVTAPANFQVSKDNSTFSSSITFVAGTDFTLPTLSGKTIYIRFAPVSGINGEKDGEVTISSQLAEDATIYVSGTETGNANTPSLNTTGTLNNFGDVYNGEFSDNQTFTLSGDDLTDNVVVTAPANFQVSKDGVTFSSSITYTKVVDFTLPTLSSQTIYVRFAPASGANGTKTGDITINSQNASQITIQVAGKEAGNISNNVSFNGSTGNVEEGNDSAIALFFDFALQQTETVTLTVTNGTGVAYDVDYTTSPAVSNSTITFTADAGSEVISFNLNAIIDNNTEADETVTFTISSVSSGLAIGIGKTYTMTIKDGAVTALSDELANKTILYPNPAQKEVFVRLPTPEIYKVSVMDLTGKVITQQSVSQKIDISMLKAGCYIVRFTNDKNSFTKKILVD